jgi:two-component system, LytTR family, sensor kinase
LVALILTGYDTAFFFFDRWNKSLLETEALKRMAVQGQLEALQTQLDPHFLFNNFNTLATLIDEDAKLASQYVAKLSQVYRYVLQNRTEDTVSLRDELEFIKSYLFIAQIRFGDNLKVILDIPSQYLEKKIPPMTLQLLCENAIKHNIVSKSSPLTVSIFTYNQHELVIKNNLQLKNKTEISTKIGLENIIKRYTLLGQPKPVIETEKDFFTVKIPLI